MHCCLGKCLKWWANDIHQGLSGWTWHEGWISAFIWGGYFWKRTAWFTRIDPDPVPPVPGYPHSTWTWVMEISPPFLWGLIILYKWVFPKIGVLQNGWFIVENPFKMDDLGVLLFLETPKSVQSIQTTTDSQYWNGSVIHLCRCPFFFLGLHRVLQTWQAKRIFQANVESQIQQKLQSDELEVPARKGEWNTPED